LIDNAIRYSEQPFLTANDMPVMPAFFGAT
jgi:hypothetical protein